MYAAGFVATGFSFCGSDSPLGGVRGRGKPTVAATVNAGRSFPVGTNWEPAYFSAINGLRGSN